MSNIIETLVVKIASDITEFQNGINDALKSSIQFEQSVNKIGNFGKSISNMGTKISDVGSDLTKKLTVPIVGLGTAIGKIGMDFESQMSKVEAISGASGSDIEKLAAKAKEMGATTKFSATESGQALEYMAMAGWKTDQMIDGLQGVMNLAAASGEDLALTSDIVTDALTAFGMQAEESSHFADILAATSSNSNTNVALMGETFKYVAPVAGALGYSVEDTAQAIGIMANAGIKGSQAGTALRSTITRMVKPTKESESAMRELELSITRADGTVKPFSEVIGDLRGSFANCDDAQKAFYAAQIAGQEGMSGLLAIVNASEEDFNKLSDSIANADGTSKRMADTMNDNLKGKLTILKSSLEGVALQLFDVLVPSFKKVVEKIQDVITWFSNLSQQSKEVITKFAGILAIIGPVLLVVGKLAKGVGSIITTFSKMSSLSPLLSKIGLAIGGISAPVLAVIAVIGALVAIFVGLYKTNEEFRTKIQLIWGEISKFFSATFEGIKQLAENIFNGLKEFWDTWGSDILASLSSIWDKVGIAFNLALDALILLANKIFNSLKEFWDIWGADILSAFAMIWNTLTEVFSDVLNKIVEIATLIFDGLKEFWDTWGEDISKAFMDVFNVLIDFFNTVFKGIWDTAKVIFDNIKTFWDDWGDVILGMFKGVFEFIWNLVKTVFNKIKKFWDDWGNVISTAFVAIWKLICNTFGVALKVLQDVFNIFVGIFTGDWKKVWDGIKGIFTSIWEGIKGSFEIVLGTIWNIAKDIFDKIKTSVSEKFAEVNESINKILNSIKSLFKGLPEKAIEWGHNMIDGFVKGIKNAASKVTDSVKGVISNVSDFLKFNSPAKKGEGRYIVNWGYNMIDGFLDGVNKAVPLLNSTMEKVIPDINNAIEDINVYAKGKIDVPEKVSDHDSKRKIENNTEIIINTEGLFRGAILSVRDDSDIDKIVRMVLERLADFIARKNRNNGLQGV